MGERSPDWIDEIDLDPESTWLRMGTRSLGRRPWLVIDGHREAEVALKERLSAEHGDAVFAALDGTEHAGTEVLALVAAALGERYAPPVGVDRGRHPLERAGRQIQEDLCLLRRASTGWLLVAGSVCFPSRWRLADKMGLPLVEVHAPVEGYDHSLAGRVDSLFDHLDDKIVWRRNWFVHPDASLYQPDRPLGGDPVIDAEHCLDELYLRSERQTIRRLPSSGLVLFTIKIQTEPVRRLVETEQGASRLANFVSRASSELADHHGIGHLQRRPLLAALASVDGS